MELVVKEIIFNIKFFVAHSDRALQNPACSNDVTYSKSGLWPARRSSQFLGKAQYWHKAYQVWCTIEFLLISFKTDKETFASCLFISGHSNSSPSGKFYPPSFISSGVKETRLGYLITLHLIVVLGAFYHRRVL